MRSRLLLLSISLGMSLTACLDPLADDTPPFQGVVHSSDWHAMDLEDDPDFADKVALFDRGTIPRLSGFGGGERVWFWRFPANGDAGFAVPIYKLRDCVNDQAVPGALDIIDVVPGDPAYSPLWRVFYACVTDRYAGEIIASRQGLDDAMMLGLVSEVRPTPLIVNCPVVARGSRLALGPPSAGMPEVFAEPVEGYYRERRTRWFGFAEQAITLGESDVLPAPPVYVVQRINQADPLDETRLDRDLTGDGDTNDTNLVFSRGREDMILTPLWRPVRARVAADVSGIDTTRDETMSDLRIATSLVDREGRPVAGTVIRMDEPAANEFFIANIQRVAGVAGGY